MNAFDNHLQVQPSLALIADKLFERHACVHVCIPTSKEIPKLKT